MRQFGNLGVAALLLMPSLAVAPSVREDEPKAALEAKKPRAAVPHQGAKEKARRARQMARAAAKRCQPEDRA